MIQLGQFYIQVIQHNYCDIFKVSWDKVFLERKTRNVYELFKFVVEANNLVKLLITPYRDWIKLNKSTVLTPLPYIWCLVGNVIEKRYYGENKEIHRGTRKFSSNTKVYCFPTQWKDGYDQIKVIGRPRFSQKYILSIMSSKHIANWRIQKVYTPYIIKKMFENHGWIATDESRDKIVSMLKWLPERTKKVNEE